MQCYLPLWGLYSDFGDFNDGVCHGMKISLTLAECTPDFGDFNDGVGHVMKINLPQLSVLLTLGVSMMELALS